MLQKINMNSEIANNINQTTTEITTFNHKKYILSKMILDDMAHLLQT
jgi:hypothetical protein